MSVRNEGLAMAGFAAINHIISSGYPLAIIETDNAQRVMSMLTEFSIKRGGALYHWVKGEGVHRRGMNHILVPRTETASRFLSYINHANHFGIYMAQDFDEYLEDDSIQIELLRMAAKTDNIRRIVVIITNKAKIPKHLAKITVTVKHANSAKKKSAMI